MSCPMGLTWLSCACQTLLQIKTPPPNQLLPVEMTLTLLETFKCYLHNPPSLIPTVFASCRAALILVQFMIRVCALSGDCVRAQLISKASCLKSQCCAHGCNKCVLTTCMKKQETCTLGVGNSLSLLTSHEEEVLRKDSKAHRAEDKGVSVPLGSRQGAGQPGPVPLESPQTRSWAPPSHEKVGAPPPIVLKIKSAHGPDTLR